jgi:hypothetical protein
LSALYRVQYQSANGFGDAVVYIGKGKILGMDITASHYDGSYAEQNGHLQGTATFTSTGVTLVTGQAIPAGEKAPITFNWPRNLAYGQPLQAMVGGHPVSLKLTKIEDVP